MNTNTMYTVVGKCENGHTQEIVLHNFSEQQARTFAAILDDTHPLYSPCDPQYGPSTIAHCNTCGSLVDCRVHGPDGKELT